MTRAPAISVVIPIYDEVDALAPLLRELGEVLDQLDRTSEIVAVDDGSTDGTWERLRALGAGEPRLRAVRLARNYGQTAALAAGIEQARAAVIVTMDADLQNDPHDIPALLAGLAQGADVVNGWRTPRRDPWLTRRLPSQVANWFISVVTGTSLHDYGCTLRAMRASFAKDMQLYGELHRFIPALAADLGAQVVELPVHHRPRTIGTSKYGVWRTLRVLLDLLTVKFLSGFVTRPIQLFGLVGLVCAAIGIGLTGYLGFERLVLGVPLSGRPLVLLAILLAVVGVQFVSIGLLGEMLVRIYHESQRKPIYRVRELAELTSEDAAAMRDRP